MPIGNASRISIDDIKEKSYHEIKWSDWTNLVANHNGLCKEIDVLVERLENLENFVKEKFKYSNDEFEKKFDTTWRS
tara:strand:- start:958 stop:1188 length:231 start_codon:yes stop_codon:yes gene_type:complete